MSEQLIPTPSVFGETGNFLLERELGKGGMGGVYMGRDKMLDRPVAVKVMLKEYGSDASFVEKFKKEAQAAARLIHPNIAQVYSYGIADSMPYIAMELVAGGSLDAIMRNQGANIDIPRVMKICEQVAQALRCAADQGLVHGDVKPENVLLDANGNAKLVDFGLAAMQMDTDEIWGTPYYIAPEKVKKEPVDYRADMYSLGGTIYHALTGVAPFEGDDANAVVRKRFEAPPKKPSEVRPGISPQIDFLVMKMLALKPQDRYPSFEALLVDFKKVMATGLSVSSASVATPTSAGGSGRKVTLRTKRKMTVRSATSLEPPEVEEEVPEMEPEEGSEEAYQAQNKRPRLKTLKERRKATLMAAPNASEAPQNDNVAAKVLMFVGGLIGAIVLIALILWGVTASRANSKLAADAAGVAAQINTATASLQKSRKTAESMLEDLAEKATAAEAECVAPTKKIRQLLSEKYTERVLSMMKPAPTKELLDAIASTNEVVEAKAEKKADAPAAEGGAAPAAAPAAARAAAPVARFRDPVDDEADPNSPDGQKYLAEKAKWEAEQQTKAANPQPAEEVAPAAEGTAGADNGLCDEVPPVVKKISDMWEMAYASRAAEIRCYKRLTELMSKIDGVLSSELISNPSDAGLTRLGDLTNGFVSDLEGIRSSKDIDTIAKARSKINGVATRQIADTERRLREEAAQAQRKADKEAAEAAEKKRLEELAAAKAAKVEQEVEAAKKKFQAVVNAGNIRQLDWKSARRTLDNLKAETETAEGQIQVGKELKKIECMELMQKQLINCMKDYTFKRGAAKGKKNLKDCTVTKVDAANISYLKKGAKKETVLPWVVFIRDYHNNLDEVITAFIVKNGAIGNDTKNRLSKKDRFNAITGVAFILRIACTDEPSSAVYAEKLLKNAVKDFPALIEQAKEFFPDIDFSDVASEVSAEQL